MSVTKISTYIARLLRHQPELLGLTMDAQGWVSVAELIQKINEAGSHRITEPLLEDIVRSDSKGRFRFSEDGTRIRACQGHSVPWVEPELTYGCPPEHLYHGTTAESWQKIRESGEINRMSRHAVHMQAEEAKAWQSARRWRRTPVVLKIDAAAMYADGARFGVSDNDVWCTEAVPVRYVLAVLDDGKEH